MATLKNTIVTTATTSTASVVNLRDKNNKELRHCLQYEISKYPLSVFNELGNMRKTQKSLLYTLFTSHKQLCDIETRKHFVIDGGFILHKVWWQSYTEDNMPNIIEKYVDYIKRWRGGDDDDYDGHHHGDENTRNNVMVVFDGYPIGTKKNNVSSTKAYERLQRRLRGASKLPPLPRSIFESCEHMTKMDFLLNSDNKRALIELLLNRLELENITVLQADEDADRIIVNSAISISQQNTKEGRDDDAVIIVGEDTDLVVLLTAAMPTRSNIFMLKVGRGNRQGILYSPNDYLLSHKSKQNILFLHAFSGCDTTSSFFGKGKLTLFKILEKYSDPDLLAAAQVFNRPDASVDEIVAAGNKCIVALYGGDGGTSLHTLRYKIAREKMSLTSASLDLSKLPPTEATAKQHSLRVYLQVNSVSFEIFHWLVLKHALIPSFLFVGPSMERKFT